MKTIEDICKVYIIDYSNKDYINNFEKCFDALYDLREYIKNNIGLNTVKLIPYIPYNNKAGLLVLLVSIHSNEFKEIEVDVKELSECCNYFFNKYDLDITKNIFIDLENY